MKSNFNKMDRHIKGCITFLILFYSATLFAQDPSFGNLFEDGGGLDQAEGLLIAIMVGGVVIALLILAGLDKLGKYILSKFYPESPLWLQRIFGYGFTFLLVLTLLLTNYLTSYWI